MTRRKCGHQSISHNVILAHDRRDDDEKRRQSDETNPTFRSRELHVSLGELLANRLQFPSALGSGLWVSHFESFKGIEDDLRAYFAALPPSPVASAG
jgi:hypothetical protein